MALANCCQNPLLKWIYRLINDIRSHNQWSARKDNVLTPERIRFYNEDHWRLMVAIRRRDQNLAADIIRSPSAAGPPGPSRPGLTGTLPDCHDPGLALRTPHGRPAPAQLSGPRPASDPGPR